MAGFFSNFGSAPAFLGQAVKSPPSAQSADLSGDPYNSGKYRGRDPIDPRIVYKIESRARKISIKLDAASRIAFVTAPKDSHMKAAREFVREQAEWIKVHLGELPPPQPFKHGEKIYYRGQLTQLIQQDGRGPAKFKPAIKDERRGIHTGPRLMIPAPKGTLAGRTKRFLIRQARAALEPATHNYAQKLGKKVSKISVRDTKSRWGSCTHDGHISYSWRLICAPEWVLDYVAAHEAAHLVEANHSQDFWDVVDRLVDTSKAGQKWLRQHGPKLHAVGADY